MVEDPRPTERQTPTKSFTVASIETSDVLEVFAKGLRDFRQAPSYGLVFGCIYGIGGWLLLALLLLLDLPLLAYPLAAGFAIIAPFIAYAFYCVSDCLERDASLTWGRVVRKNPRPMVFLGYDNRHDGRPVAAFLVLWPVHGTAGSEICVLASVSPRRPNQRR